MGNYNIISAEPMSGSEVVEILTKKEKERELTYREDRTKEYLKKVTKLDKKKFEAAKKELLGLEIPRLEEKHIIKILEIMPKTGTELRSIVSHSGTVLVDESVTKILDVLNKL